MPPRTTAIGALAFYVAHANPSQLPADEYPFGIMERRRAHSRQSKEPRVAMSERALADLEEFRRRAAEARSAIPKNVLCVSAALRRALRHEGHPQISLNIFVAAIVAPHGDGV